MIMTTPIVVSFSYNQRAGPRLLDRMSRLSRRDLETGLCRSSYSSLSSRARRLESVREAKPNNLQMGNTALFLRRQELVERREPHRRGQYIRQKLWDLGRPAAFHDSSSTTVVSDDIDATWDDYEAEGDNVIIDEDEPAVADNDSPIILRDLNPSQIRAVTQPIDSVTRVIAGPGSGKTRVLTCRIAHLLQADPQSRILGVTFTRKAAGEMQERLERLLISREAEEAEKGGRRATRPHITEEDTEGSRPQPKGIRRVTLGTFHSVCARILRASGDRLSILPSVVTDMAGSRNETILDGNFAIIDQGDQLGIVRQCLEETDTNLELFGLKPLHIVNGIAEVKAKLAFGKDPYATTNDKPLSKPLRVTQRIYSLYRENLLAKNCIDFDDIMLLTRELLIHHEDVREALRDRWKHVLVDEFQDTSLVQVDLVRMLTSKSLFVVGDADQSIYSWRGASAGSLSDFENIFHEHGVSSVYLMENYRSTKNIVHAAQKVISSSTGARPTGADKIRQKMKPKRGSGPKPRVVACKDSQAEGKPSDVVATAIHAFFILFNDVIPAQSRVCCTACERKNILRGIRPKQICGAHLSYQRSVACSGRSLRAEQSPIRCVWVCYQFLQTPGNKGYSLLPPMDL
jgi:UvrD/REP helicase N-terminal domain